MAAIIPTVSLNENSRVFVDGAVIAVKTGSIDETPDEVDTGCTLTGGYSTQSRGRYKCMFSFEGQWQAADNPFTEAPNLIAGQNSTNVLIYPDFVNNNGTPYSFPVAYIRSSKVQIRDQDVGYSVDGKNQGQYDSPAADA